MYFSVLYILYSVNSFVLRLCWELKPGWAINVVCGKGNLMSFCADLIVKKMHLAFCVNNESVESVNFVMPARIGLSKYKKFHISILQCDSTLLFSGILILLCSNSVAMLCICERTTFSGYVSCSLLSVKLLYHCVIYSTAQHIMCCINAYPQQPNRSIYLP